MIEIRKATKKDVNGLCEINDQLADYHANIDSYYASGKDVRKNFRKKLLKNLERRNFLILVAVDKNKIVGYFQSEIAKAKGYKIEKRMGHLHNAYINIKYRRIGLGKDMLFLTLTWFRKNKIKFAELTVDSRNKMGNSAWNKLGFEEYMKKMKLKI